MVYRWLWLGKYLISLLIGYVQCIVQLVCEMVADADQFIHICEDCP